MGLRWFSYHPILKRIRPIDPLVMIHYFGAKHSSQIFYKDVYFCFNVLGKIHWSLVVFGCMVFQNHVLLITFYKLNNRVNCVIFHARSMEWLIVRSCQKDFLSSSRLGIKSNLCLNSVGAVRNVIRTTWEWWTSHPIISSVGVYIIGSHTRDVAINRHIMTMPQLVYSVWIYAFCI